MADRIAIQVAPKPRDTNGNKFPDTIELITYLFSGQYSSPFYEPGSFVFKLYFAGQSDRPDAKPIQVWTIEDERLEEAKAGRNLIGPYYVFQLSLLEDNGTDRYPRMPVDLVASFVPADDRPPIVRQETHRLQIGLGSGEAGPG